MYLLELLKKKKGKQTFEEILRVWTTGRSRVGKEPRC